MRTEILFSESQKFRQWWLWIILLGVNALFIYATLKQVISGEPFGDKQMSDGALMATTAGTILLTLLFMNLRLETQIRKDGVYVRFFPFQISFRQYTWDRISKSYIRQYNAIGEYGGWGLRMGMFGKGNALNVSGNKGLQLLFTDERKLLIGTKKPDELHETLQAIGQLKS